MVEAEFHTLLPSNYETLMVYLGKKYTSKLDKEQYQSDALAGPIWGSLYLLYQAGRKDDFYSILKDDELR